MKKLLAILTFLLATSAFAQGQQGPKVNVELVSGTKQSAQFLGIQNDTVQLGGYIKNQFTVIRLHKDKFKSIVDEQGNDLLHPAPAAVPAQADTATVTAVADSAIANSAATDSTDLAAAAAPATQTWSGNIFVSFEGTYADTLLSQQLTAIAATLLYEANEQVQIIRRSDIPECHDNICIQNTLLHGGAKNVYVGKMGAGSTPDSIGVELSKATLHDDLPEIYMSKINVAKNAALSSAIENNKMKVLLMQAKPEPEAIPVPKTSYISVETTPEGATVSRPDINAICRTPCTFPTRDTNKITLNAYWNVGEQLWGAQSVIRPIPGDTTKVNIKLKPISPEIHVISTPSDAEVFAGSAPITKHSETLIKTPGKFHLNDPGMANITLRRAGYRDTVVSFYVAPVAETRLNIEMERITNVDDIAKQKEWEHDRTMLRVGHILMGTSIAPLIMGAIFAYLGSQDYDDADEIKSQLQMPGSSYGENFQNKVKKNHDLVDSGDKKMIIGASLAGASVILFGVGFFLAF